MAYDYHRPINSTELSPLQGRGLHSDGTTSTTGDIESGDMKECVICYNVIDVEENEYMVSLVWKDCVSSSYFTFLFRSHHVTIYSTANAFLVGWKLNWSVPFADRSYRHN